MDWKNEERPAAGHVAESDVKDVEEFYQTLVEANGDAGGTAEVEEEEAPPDSYEADCKAYLDSEGWKKSEAVLSQKFRREMAGTAEYEAAKTKKRLRANEGVAEKVRRGGVECSSQRPDSHRHANRHTGLKGGVGACTRRVESRTIRLGRVSEVFEVMFHESRRHKMVRKNPINQRVEFLTQKDIVDSLHHNSWSLRTVETERPASSGDTGAGGSNGGEPVTTPKPGAKAKAKAKGKAAAAGGGGGGAPNLTPGRGKSAVDLKLEDVLNNVDEYKTVVEEGQRFIRNVAAKEDEWDKLERYVPDVQLALKKAQDALQDFGKKALDHDKTALKSMYTEHLLVSEGDAFLTRMKDPLNKLHTCCKKVFNMRRASETFLLDNGKKVKKRRRQ